MAEEQNESTLENVVASQPVTEVPTIKQAVAPVINETPISEEDAKLKHFEYDSIPIVDIVNDMISDAAKKGASDIHFDPHDDYLLVRTRLDGVLVDYAKVPPSVQRQLITRIKNISKMNITESRLPQDGSIKGIIEGLDLDLRVSCLPVVGGEKIVVRILDYTRSSEGLDNLGFCPENLEKINKMIATPNGIIIISGATGTGKSTTVYAMLQKMNVEGKNIITVEEPVEMVLEGINQVSVMSEIGLTFTSALRSILRQDPDIIMIGEIRDDETARIAVRASITGHLVLSTLHTNNSLNTIERLLDMEVERYLLGSALTGIVAQRLARKICKHCQIERDATNYEKNVIHKALGITVDKLKDINPNGCEHCNAGFKGRIAIHEVLLINEHIRDAIVNNIRKDELKKLVYEKENVISLLQDGLKKVVSGETNFSEILRLIELNDDYTGDEDEGLKEALIGKEFVQLKNGSPVKTSDPSELETLF